MVLVELQLGVQLGQSRFQLEGAQKERISDGSNTVGRSDRLPERYLKVGEVIG